MTTHADLKIPLYLGLIFLGWFVIAPNISEAALTGACAECHVMHASETNDAGATTIHTANAVLLRNNCLGCHNGTAGIVGAPHVINNAGGPLAAGDYGEITVGTERYGHNPEELGVADAMTTPPGWATLFTDVDGNQTASTWGGADKLQCGGTNGCHGNHDEPDALKSLDGAHHKNLRGTINADDADVIGNSYRFLLGVYGYEDPNYESTATFNAASARNVYYGVARTGDANSSQDKHTMSYFCALCHGAFHSDSTDGGSGGIATAGLKAGAGAFGGADVWTDPWIRHPSDIDMPVGTTEFATYSYTQAVPVATSVVGDLAGPATHNGNVGTATHRVVMCLSCHRAHASSNRSALRWDPSTVKAGVANAGVGCFACHTAKDDAA